MKKTTTATFTDNGYILDPGTVYSNLDAAMQAASCLSGLHEEGASIYVNTDPKVADPHTGEAYVIACASVRADGSTWPEPDAMWEPVYTITKAKRPSRRPKTYSVVCPDGSIMCVMVPEND